MVALGLGCTEQSQVTVSPESVPAHAKIAKADDLPKRTPKASTCVAFGDLRLKGVIKGDFQGPDRETALEQARKAYEQALRIDPKNVEACQGLGLVHQQLGDYDGALAIYHKGLKVNSGAASLWFEMGMCEARHGDWKTAVENLKKASDMDPDNRAFIKSLAFALARTGRCDESVVCFKKIMDESQAHYNVARLLHHFNQDGLSMQQVQLALQGNPNNSPAMELQADLEGRSTAPGQPAIAGRSPAPPAIDIDDISQELDQRPGSAN
jgi:tetratricopeptide (TPR) repeat protein